MADAFKEFLSGVVSDCVNGSSGDWREDRWTCQFCGTHHRDRFSKARCEGNCWDAEIEAEKRRNA